MSNRILIAASSDAGARRIRERLGRSATTSVAVAEPGRLWPALRRNAFDVVLVTADELGEPAERDVARIRRQPGEPDVVLFEPKRAGCHERHAAMLSAGCTAVVNTDLPDALLASTLELLLRRRSERTMARLCIRGETEACTLADFDSTATAMQETLALARAAIGSHSTVLIAGETGVGKERLARALHADGPRNGRPFVTLNSGAIVESLAESELFGHERGSFTGAVHARRGLFELAHGGTLFFDEISEMTPALQVKLLRALEEGTIRRVGSEQEIAVDVRLIAATNRELRDEVSAGRFRPDLYYRLAVVSLSIPPLRRRPEDLSGLIDRCLRTVCTRLARPVPGLGEHTRQALVRYRWPGNVRELQNVLERAVLLSDGTRIDPRDLPREIGADERECWLDLPRDRCVGGGRSDRPEDDGTRPALRESTGGIPPWRGRPLLECRKELVEHFERAYLVDTLRLTQGRTAEAARRAGISTRSLSDMLKRHALRREDFWSGRSALVVVGNPTEVPDSRRKEFDEARRANLAPRESVPDA